MIARIWHGWTRVSRADAYRTLLLDEVLPSIVGADGYRGVDVFERVDDEGGAMVEFLTITYFDDLDSAHAFSERGRRGAVVPPEARALLERFDLESQHYRIVHSRDLGPPSGQADRPDTSSGSGLAEG